MKGCPYSEWNWEKDCEVCRLTGKPTEGAIMCDFGFDEECDIGNYISVIKKF